MEAEMTWRELMKEFVKEYYLTAIGVLVAIGFVAAITVFGFTENAKEKKEDRRTTFEASGTVQSFRSVFDETGFLQSVVKKVYVTVNGQEYEVSNDLSHHMSKGDKVKISGKRGRIETFEKVN